MQKIDFVNAQQPAINDTNLNLMQTYIENAINAQVSGDTLPVASIIPYTSDTVPENWLICDGSAISRTTYDLLFSIIGTTYGVGDGSTTFNLPNLKGRIAVGKASTQAEFDALGKTGGEKTHTLTIDEMPSHNHSFYAKLTYTGSGSDGTGLGQGTDIRPSESIGNTGGGQAHNNLQPYITLNYIIKAQQSAGVVATVVDNLTSTSATDALSAKQGKVLNDDITSVKNRFAYSTTEKVIGTWIDGKPLYRKVLTETVPQNGGTNYPIAHNISNLGVIVHQELNCTNSNGNTYPQHNDIYDLYIKDTDSQSVWCNISGGFWNWLAIIVLEYTKTTDIA